MQGFLQQNVSRRAFLAGLALASLGASGCSASENSDVPSSDSQTVALSMLTAGIDYEDFYAALREAKPEVDLSFESYVGYNTTDYIYALMSSGKLDDIVSKTYANDADLQKERLVDLSAYDFINSFNTRLINDAAVDGAVYLLPSSISFLGPYYNKTLFDVHGWNEPKSLEELEELVPKIKKAGVEVSVATTTFPGSCVGFFWDVLAPEFTSTLEGIQWRQDFLAGKANATGALEPYVETLQKWIDLGMFNIPADTEDDDEVVAKFMEGNTAFLMTVSDHRLTQNEDGTGDEYRIMPWLSKDGSNNITVTNVRRYYGINKEVLGSEGREEAAFAVMEFLATEEAQQSLLSYENLISPLNASAVAEDSPLYGLSQMIDSGNSMPLVHPGWEKFMAPFGAEILRFMEGDIASVELLERFDGIRADLAAGTVDELAQATEDLDLEQVAKLCGAAFAQAVDADCALVSVGGFHGFGKENKYGCNGKIFADVPIDANQVCAFNPLGWKGTIKVGTLSGEAIKKWAEEGFFVEGDDEPFEYILTTKGDVQLDDAKTYKVALVDESASRASECNMEESEFLGQRALVDYVKSLGSIDSKNVNWA